MALRSLFVMDPLTAINVRGDSTYVTMAACVERGFPVHWCTPGGLYARDGRAKALCQPVQVNRQAPHFEPGPTEDHDLGDFDVVWMRKDPPFDMDYIFSTYLLDMAPPTTLVVNDPASLKRFNEKMWATKAFARFQPPTLVSRDPRQIRAFVEEQPGKAVLKPWDGNGGRGVLITQKGDRNLGSMIDVLTAEGRSYLIAQGYVPAAEQGDKRILLFGGKVVGAMLRVPAATDFRANMHVGGQVVACDLTEKDLEICGALGPELERHGLLFVGIDVIGEILTEINVTSPTGIQEINRLYGKKLEDDLVDCVNAWRSRPKES